MPSREVNMRAFPALILAVAGAALCTDALAQDRDGLPQAPAPSATTGVAPSAPALQAPIGHRQPTSANAPSRETNGAPVSPYDQQIDRNLDICRGC
jgi:hypothetical protein